MYRSQIGLKVKIRQSGSVLEHIVYIGQKEYTRQVRVLSPITGDLRTCNSKFFYE